MSVTGRLLFSFATVGFFMFPIPAEAQYEQFVRSKPHVNVGSRSHPDFMWLPTNVTRAAKRKATSPTRRTTTGDVLLHRWQGSGIGAAKSRQLATKKSRGGSPSSNARIDVDVRVGSSRESRNAAPPNFLFPNTNYGGVRSAR